MEIAVKEGKYIYCVIGTNGLSERFGTLGIGGRGDELYTIYFQDIGAVVSNSPIKKYPVSSENALSHEKAIEEVMKYHTVLPVRYCTIAEDEEKVKKILEKEYDKFKNLLKNISGKKELGLKAIFKEVIYNDIVDKYEYIKRLKEKITGKPPETTYYLRMEIGKMVERALEREKEKYKDEMLNTLRLLSEEMKINNTYGERMILNAAFLIKKDKEAEFDLKVNELVERHDDKIRFKYVGPLPPFNFVNLVINTEF